MDAGVDLATAIVGALGFFTAVVSVLISRQAVRQARRSADLAEKALLESRRSADAAVSAATSSAAAVKIEDTRLRNENEAARKEKIGSIRAKFIHHSVKPDLAEKLTGAWKHRDGYTHKFLEITNGSSEPIEDVRVLNGGGTTWPAKPGDEIYFCETMRRSFEDSCTGQRQIAESDQLGPGASWRICLHPSVVELTIHLGFNQNGEHFTDTRTISESFVPNLGYLGR